MFETRRAQWALCLTFAALGGVGYGRSDYAANNRALARFARAVRAVPLPPDAIVEDTFTEVGLLQGNGNHCDYFVALRLRAGANATALAAYLRQRALPAPGGGETTLEVWAPAPPDDELARRLPADWPRAATVVYASWFGQDANHDMRCH
jgi:hypothetical protein